MCGIIACRGTTGAADYLITGLTLLEYRGYDSAGISVAVEGETTAVFRTTSRVGSLRELVSAWGGPRLGGSGIGHTRWATHGGVSVTNAHPHQDCHNRISAVHNGIIENADSLRAQLESDGHSFASEGDSEVICHLIEQALVDSDDLLQAVTEAVSQLVGSWAIVVLDGATGRMVGARHRSPLLVAQSEEGSFLASDISAIADWVDNFHILGDGDIVDVSDTLVWTTDGAPAPVPQPITAPPRAIGRALDRDDHMAHEIQEQPEVAARVLQELGGDIATGRLWRRLDLPRFDRLRLLACGTSLNAGQVIGQALGRLGGIPFEAVIASEAADSILGPNTLTLAISQSGETADVLRAVEEQGSTAPVLALVNNTNSSLARAVDAVQGCTAGPEVGVAATKTFVCQVLTGTALMISALADSQVISHERARDLVDDLYGMPERLAAATTAALRELPAIIAEVRDASGFVFLGRGAAVPYAMEGALKLKELSYRWAEAYPAGELKHGPLALIESGTPVVVVDDGNLRLAGNIAEVRARGGNVITVGRSGSRVTVPLSALAPCGPLEAVVPLQLLALTLATELGYDVDKPRNLAKSVTVD